MTKKNKAFVTLLTAATMMTASAFASFAAQNGWNLEGGKWFYYQGGDKVTSCWKEDTQHLKYWLDDNGQMAVSELIDDGSNIYYVTSSGARLTNDWKWIQADGDDEAHWYYFDSNGKAVEKGWQTINGYKYHFTDHKMDYGWIDENGTMLDEDNDNDSAWETAKYYLGSEETGWRRDNQWVELDDFDTDKYDERDTVWVYMDNSGKKVTSKQMTINKVKYRFDENGAMMNDWYASDSNARYYNDNGQMSSGKWFQAVPSDDMNSTDHNSDTQRWFYANSNGNIVKNTIKKINGKRYVFDADGIMQTGFVVVDASNHVVENLGDGIDNDYPTAAEIKAVTNGTVMFCMNNGAVRTGNASITLDDDTYKFKFNSAGKAYDGIDDGYLYRNGIVLAADADDEKYSIEEYAGKYFLVNTSGKIQKAGTYKDSKADCTYVVEGNNADGYTVTRQ